MTAHADGARGRAEAPRDLRGAEFLAEGQLQDRAVISFQLLERREDARSLLCRDQRREGPLRRRAVSGGGSESLERPALASGRPHAVQANANGGLKNVARQGVEVLDASFAKGLVHPDQRLLRDVLGGIPVSKPPRGKEAQPSSKGFELPTHLVGMFWRAHFFGV